MNTEKLIDMVIIGGGPIGLNCAIEATKARLSYLVLEKGCLVNSIYNYPLNMTFFSTSEKLEIGDVPFISHGPKPVRSEALEYYSRVTRKWNIKLALYTSATGIEKEENGYKITTNKGYYRAKAIVIATGFYDIPNPLNIAGENLPKVMHYFREAHPYFSKKVVVIGAANSAIDVALECYRKNAEVTLVIREYQISDRVKYWVKPDIENRIKEGAIKVYFNSWLENITEETVSVKTPEDLLILQNDFVFAMTGYLPDFSLLQKAGIEFQKDKYHTPSFNSETMETNQSNIYLAGVICGGMNTHQLFIENSRIHAEIIIRNFVEKSGRLN